MGPLKQYLNEAACVLPMPEFVHVVENPSPEYILEVSIGYPFIDYAPVPNFFGYGPEIRLRRQALLFLPDYRQAGQGRNGVRLRSPRR